ncbi:FAD-dependent oxidoreductase [Phragmitibacter flavus]|uniref:FAD-dependent oxidoreductase n=1 Tax=Phragmitibacter flavus TaxID=2576071 RepID=A0A5R8KKD5_9BACT|nr:FAD-dependent oxidoreductase [Phragmitibacter flavus]TLD72079.1 FAD-dependent oxidoreductase [Phragmitibacter flavus]
MRALISTLAIALTLVSAGSMHAETQKPYDLVVYGGSSAGIAAAVQIKRMGGTVVIIEPSQRIGGLTTGGLGQTDIGNKHVIGGIAREFYQQVRQWYNLPEAWKWEPQPKDGKFVGTGQSKTDANEDTLWTFEPSVALTIYQRWIKENDIPVVFGERLDRSGEGKSADRGDGFHIAKPGSVAKGVIKDGNRITAIVMESGKRFEGRHFMDATYEGDLMAAAGVAFTKGREGRSVYGEGLNGVQLSQARHHQLVDGVDPYVIKGDPSSGLLPGIDTNGPLVEGASDHRIQAYCFRMCLTDVDENRIPFHKPEGYDEQRYELLFRNYEAGAKGFPWINSMMPNRKTDTNNRDGFSTDFIGQNYDWPEASYDARLEIRAKHLTYQQGLMWTLAHHPRTPEYLREVYSKWGMTKDEFTEGDGWQAQIYVREGRRMISDLVMTQHHCERIEAIEHSVGMGAYTMDSHHVQRHINAAGHVKNEGDVQVGGFPPYPIDYRSIVPRESECSNLTVPIALSASHIAFGSIRMEPVFMILGQSGATAAMHAIEQKTSLQKVDPEKLKARLLEDKQILDYEAPNHYIKLNTLSGVIVDDTEARLEGPWNKGSLPYGVHKGYHHADPGAGICKAFFTLHVPADGVYSVQLASLPNANRSTKTRVRVRSSAGAEEMRIDQRSKPPVDGLWIPLQEITLKADEEVTVFISNEDSDGHVILDAARLLPKKQGHGRGWNL